VGDRALLAKLGLERRTQAAVMATRLLGEHPTEFRTKPA
jgi:hypothetical protein